MRGIDVRADRRRGDDRPGERDHRGHLEGDGEPVHERLRRLPSADLVRHDRAHQGQPIEPPSTMPPTSRAG